MRLINGGLAATGPGITVTIDGDTPVLAMNLVDLVNELWASGAEAISINGHRMMAQQPLPRWRMSILIILP